MSTFFKVQTVGNDGIQLFSVVLPRFPVQQRLIQQKI